MTTTLASRLAHVTLLAAVAAAGFSVATAQAGGPATVRIVELPRVTIVARRAEANLLAATASEAATTVTPRVIELPRVLVVAKRLAPATTLVAGQKNGNPSGV